MLLSRRAVALACCCWASPGFSETFFLGADVVSRYLFRGFDFNHRDPALQLSATHVPRRLPNLWVNAWTSAGLTRDAPSGDARALAFDEVDVSLGYGFAAGKYVVLQPQFGHFYYLSDYATRFGGFPTDMEAGLKATVTAPAVTIEAYYGRGLDPGIRGNFISLGLKRDIAFAEDRAGVTPTLSGGYTTQYGLGGKFTALALAVPWRHAVGPVTIRTAAEIQWIPHARSFGSKDRFPLSLAMGVGWEM